MRRYLDWATEGSWVRGSLFLGSAVLAILVVLSPLPLLARDETMVGGYIGWAAGLTIIWLFSSVRFWLADRRRGW